jgi:protein TonB
VVLEVDIEPSGEVRDARVVRSAGCPELDAAALEAVRRARFEPARRGGVPVPCTVLQPVVFNLE